MKISIITAADEGGVIGLKGKIPWHLPADFKRFKELTMGHPIIMGRKTFESIGRLLPGRTNIVITRDANYKPEGVVAAASLEAALALESGADEVFIIGGEQIYKLALPKADTVYFTRVQGSFEGDAFFPELKESEWELASSKFEEKDEKNPIDHAYLVYQRRPSS